MTSRSQSRRRRRLWWIQSSKFRVDDLEDSSNSQHQLDYHEISSPPSVGPVCLFHRCLDASRAAAICGISLEVPTPASPFSPRQRHHVVCQKRSDPFASRLLSTQRTRTNAAVHKLAILPTNASTSSSGPRSALRILPVLVETSLDNLLAPTFDNSLCAACRSACANTDYCNREHPVPRRIFSIPARHL